MTCVSFMLLAATSVWICPGIQPRHSALRVEFMQAMAKGDAPAMESACRRGIELVPDDPVWHYNLACSLARKGEKGPALDALEKAVALGWRDAEAVSTDADLEPLMKERRFAAAVDGARSPLVGADAEGPFASYPADGSLSPVIVVGAQNMKWNFDAGLFEASVNAGEPTAQEPYAGLAYVNLDNRHSVLNMTGYPGLKTLMLDKPGKDLGYWQNFADTLFTCPVFGNCSRARVSGHGWRSLPRSEMTVDAARMPLMHRLYMSNQIWAYPAARDTDATTNGFGDVCSAAAPYWIFTHGYSWSDLPYVGHALKATAAMDPETRRTVISRGLLAPTIQMLLRKSLRGVDGEDGYLTSRAHPTAFPPGGIDGKRLRRLAAALRPDTVPPVASVTAVASQPVFEQPDAPEMVYATPCAVSLVLRSPDTLRRFAIRAAGGDEYAFAAVHGAEGAASVVKVRPDSALVSLDRLKISTTNRVDIAVFARNNGTSWGAPSFVSFAVIDPSAPYSDPFLVPPGRDAESGAGDAKR